MLKSATKPKPLCVEVKVRYHRIKVYINDTLHCHIDTSAGCNIQAWVDNNLYCIEYTTGCGKVLCEYEKEAVWKEIMKQINDKLE